MMIGLIAGAGKLPIDVVASAHHKNLPICILCLRDYADPANFHGLVTETASIGQAQKIIDFFAQNAVTHIVMAGKVNRPNLAMLRVDMTGARLLGRILAAKLRGDDAVLRIVAEFLEERGFTVMASCDILSRKTKSYLPPQDPLYLADVELGARVLTHLGVLDVGQAVVVEAGRIMAIEAAEGTDEMMRRIRPYVTQGVLVKAVKPAQDRRFDMPTIGPATVEIARQSNIVGIAFCDQTIVIDEDEVLQKAKQYKIFITTF